MNKQWPGIVERTKAKLKKAVSKLKPSKVDKG